MSLLTTTEILQHLETDLGTTALQRIIDGEESEIVRRYGAHDSQVDDLPGLTSLIFLARKPGSITTVVERIGSTETTLAGADYQLRFGDMALERISDTTPILWGDRVRVTYVPESQAAVRKRVLLDLVQLAFANKGVASYRAGDYSETSKDYQKERESILSTLGAGGIPFA
jgi:hypothetical protein